MKKALRTKWVKALRSGRYKQATGHLKAPNGYCCLGVLCNVVAPRAWQNETADGCSYHRTYGSDNELSDEGMKSLGLPKRLHSKLISMNDGDDKGIRSTFKDIAAFIMKKVPVS